MKIEQASCFMTQYLRNAAAGTLVPAGMQRSYVWAEADVLAMFDSILSRFPLGSIVRWTPDTALAQHGKTNLGPIDAQLATGRVSYLLDGQNRLATLAWALVPPANRKTQRATPGERALWLAGRTLVVDGETKSIRFVPDAEAEQGLRCPVWGLDSAGEFWADRKSRNRWYHVHLTKMMAQYPESEWAQFVDFVDDVDNAIRDIRIVEAELSEATPEEAKQAFLRICRTGVPMSEKDFDQAAAWSIDSEPSVGQNVEPEADFLADKEVARVYDSRHEGIYVDSVDVDRVQVGDRLYTERQVKAWLASDTSIIPLLLQLREQVAGDIEHFNKGLSCESEDSQTARKLVRAVDAVLRDGFSGVAWTVEVDPEYPSSQDRHLTVVSGYVAGRAYQELCLYLGGTNPDLRLQAGAPAAHELFMTFFGVTAPKIPQEA